MAVAWLGFESPAQALDEKVRELLTKEGSDASASQITKLREQRDKLLAKLYSNLGIWEKVQVARHADRPHTGDYIRMLIDEFDELHGDRRYADDNAIVGGIGRFEGKPVMVLGHDKGRDTDEKIYRNFGMPHPDGLRKAARLIQLAERFRMPVMMFVDTPGAYPGVEGEERGQNEAIANNLALMSRVRTPLVVTVIGEGGSGGALAIGVGDQVAMLQHSIYSVATPEACATIIWRDAAKAEDAAVAMRVNAESLLEFGLIDTIVEEPAGGAHRDHKQAAEKVGAYLSDSLKKLTKKPVDALVSERYDRLMAYGREVKE